MCRFSKGLAAPLRKAKRLITYVQVVKQESFPTDPVDAIKKGFAEADEQFLA